MTRRYQDIYPSRPILDSAAKFATPVTDLMTLEYFEAEPAIMEEAVFAQHHVLLNLREAPHRVE